ncbi:MAG: tripartite tricarboxylate transporter TctB family protein [Thermodesulfobacteriota bacterium]|nr:tripartite tricarboxylate transporter TctB family protein [Thermodesulfobacteriota bacterium]
MGKADRISGAFWFLFSLFISYESYKLGLGTVRQPGPGFLFFWTGIVIAILSLIVILISLKKQSEGELRESVFARSNMTKLLLVLGSLFLYALLIEWLGFLIVTLLLFIFLLRVIEKKKAWFATLLSLAVTAFSYLIFELGLQSQLPKGLLEFLRF